MNFYSLPKNKTFLISLKAVITDKEKVLILKNTGDKRRELKAQWELPGGLLEIDEKIEDCLIREVKEETGLMIAVKKPFATWIDKRKNFRFKDGRRLEIQVFSVGYFCKRRSGTIKLSGEHKEYAWVIKNDLANYDFSPNSKPGIEKYLKRV